MSLLPGTNVTVGQPISHRIDHMLSGTRANIAVKIFGDDLLQLRALGQQVQAEMALVPGVVDLSAEAQADIPTLRVKVDAAAASRYGLVTGAVTESLQTARVGQTVGQVLEGQIAFPLVVRYELGEDSALSAVGETRIQTPDGGQIPLSAVASLAQDRGPNFVMRENAQRRLVVQCNVAGRDLRSVVNDIQARVSRVGGAAGRLPHRVRGAVRERGRRVTSAAVAVDRRHRRHLLHPVVGVRLGPRRAADHGEPAARAHRRRGRGLSGRRRAVGGVHRRASSRSSASRPGTASCWCRTSSTCRPTKA